MSLSLEDMQYLDGKFENVYSTIGKLDKRVDDATEKTCFRLTKLETEYKEHAQQQVNNATRKYKFSTICVAIFSGIVGFFQFLS